ncbi:MAG TPA: protein phosphatase 2C domain-containing protein [Burkholderiales bacterium]|nr:protein phosphatase 2C domain-containing protein [Burkholderiales bacterium]
MSGTRIARQTHSGGRPYNQDRLGHWQTPESTLLVLADGMGGHANGDVAAQLVVEHLGAEFERAARPRLADPDLFLYRRIGSAHALLGRAARARGFEEVPRTTIIACVVQGGRAYWIHVGDSRLYHLRGGRVLERTKDHTRVQKLLDQGQIGEQDLLVHPERNVLLQCLGGPVPPRLSPATSARLARGDVLLLCSDGLWGHVGETDLPRELAAEDLDAALARLVERAVAAGGRHSDNVSAIALAWDEEDVTPVAERPAVADPRGAWAFPHVPDSDADTAIAELRRALRLRGRDALDVDLGVGEPAPAPEEEFLRMSDEDVAREVERIREVYRRMYPPRPPAAPAAAGNDEAYLRMSDEEIERAIARIRVAFRSAHPEPARDLAAPPDDYLSMTDEDIERAIERIRMAFRRGAAS